MFRRLLFGNTFAHNKLDIFGDQRLLKNIKLNKKGHSLNLLYQHLSTLNVICFAQKPSITFYIPIFRTLIYN